MALNADQRKAQEVGLEYLVGFNILTYLKFWLGLIAFGISSGIVAFWVYGFYFDSTFLISLNEWVYYAMPVTAILVQIISFWSFYLAWQLRMFKKWALIVYAGESAVSALAGGGSMYDNIKNGNWENAGRSFAFTVFKAGLTAYLTNKDTMESYMAISKKMWGDPIEDLNKMLAKIPSGKPKKSEVQTNMRSISGSTGSESPAYYRHLWGLPWCITIIVFNLALINFKPEANATTYTLFGFLAVAVMLVTKIVLDRDNEMSTPYRSSSLYSAVILGVTGVIVLVALDEFIFPILSMNSFLSIDMFSIIMSVYILFVSLFTHKLSLKYA